MITDDDTLYADLTEAERHTVDARVDVECIETDAHNWGDDGTIENAANAAASELNELLAAIQARRDQIPPAGT